MALRKGRIQDDHYHRQVALSDPEDAGFEFAALLDDYCRRVNEEPPPPRRLQVRPGRAAHA